MLVESRDPLCNTEAAVTCHYLPRVMEGLRHIYEELRGVGVPLLLPLCREGPRSIRLLWSILPLDNSDSPHDWLAVISVGNLMIIIAKRMGLARERHEPRTELVEPRVHRLVDAIQPQRLILGGVVVVECVNHLTNLM